jgi:hypothetical protein
VMKRPFVAREDVEVADTMVSLRPASRSCRPNPNLKSRGRIRRENKASGAADATPGMKGRYLFPECVRMVGYTDNGRNGAVHGAAKRPVNS